MLGWLSLRCPLLLGTGGDLVEIVYLACLVFGLVYAIWSAVTASDGGAATEADPSFDVTGDGVGDVFPDGSVHVSPLQPITIATFITTFGGFGLVAGQVWPHWHPVLVAAGGLGAGLALAAVVFFGWVRLLYGAQGSSESRTLRLVGSVAEVTLAIPKGGVGRISYVCHGSRFTASAKSADGRAVAMGQTVLIKKVGTIFEVVPQGVEEGE